jgi:ABC-type amino acid transport substrate-binding protein
MKKWIRWSLLIIVGYVVVVFTGCHGASRQIRIGIDSNWYPQNFEGKQHYVNGFIDELLLEMSKCSGVMFVRVGANWDSLVEGLHQKRYEAVISSLPQYNFNLAKYAFSINLLDIGPVLVLPSQSKASGLTELSHPVIGIVASNEMPWLIQKYPAVKVRPYENAADFFLALAEKNVDGGVIDRLDAVCFANGSYAGRVKIVSPPLTDVGLRMVALKEDSADIIRLFDKNLKYLKKKKKLQEMKKKWQLD